MHRRLGVHADSQDGWVGVYLRIRETDVGEDRGGCCCVFETFVLATVRNRYSWRLSMLEMLRTVGKTWSVHPLATSASCTA